MGFRFRKTISILPGVRLNFSKSGVSTSIGRPGAAINIGKRGVRGTVGLPGTGLSYSDMIVRRHGRNDKVDDIDDVAPVNGAGRKLLIGLVVIVLGALAIVLVGAQISDRHQEPAGFQPNSVGSAAVLVDAAEAEKPVKTADDAQHHAADANCRSNPSARASVVAVLTGDENLTVVDEQAGWSRVTTDDQDCWVSSRLVQ